MNIYIYRYRDMEVCSWENHVQKVAVSMSETCILPSNIIENTGIQFLFFILQTNKPAKMLVYPQKHDFLLESADRPPD